MANTMLTANLMGQPLVGTRTGASTAGFPLGDKKATLSAIEPFRRLPESEMADTLAVTQEMKHQKGEHVYSEGEEVSGIWVLLQGRVEIMKYTSDGKPRAIQTILPGQLFGTVYNRVEDVRTYPHTAIAYVDVTVLKIPFATFIYLSHRSLPFVTGLCAIYSQQIGNMEKMSPFSNEPVAKRVAQTLVQLSRRLGKTISMTKREIAELVGTSVETSIRTLGAFERKRWISTSRGVIRVLNVERIEAFCE